jgi:hypothetical protein
VFTNPSKYRIQASIPFPVHPGNCAINHCDDAIDPDLKPMPLQEATVSVDHQLNDVMAISDYGSRTY